MEEFTSNCGVEFAIVRKDELAAILEDMRRMREVLEYYADPVGWFPCYDMQLMKTGHKAIKYWAWTGKTEPWHKAESVLGESE